MRIKNIQLKNFKRFDDLTIDLGEKPAKIIALVGPNGCGKSSIFDAFELTTKNYKGSHHGEEPVWYYNKSTYDMLSPEIGFDRNQAIKIIRSDNTSNFKSDSFYLRSPYRFTPELNITELAKTPDILADQSRPKSMSFLDSRLVENYRNLIGMMFKEFSKPGGESDKIRAKYQDKINEILSKILDITISNLGDITEGRGQLYFEKGNTKDFPYKNLSSGEKEVIDIILDLVVKREHYTDTVFAIDEPELHLNTAIQRNLLIELEKLIPDSCQLWVATHSIGFLRALQEELKHKAQILDFSEKDYFSGTKNIKPISGTRKDWQRIFNTALEDLTGLIAPETIIYCEGKLKNSIDEEVFNNIFGKEFPNVLFVSATNQSESIRYAGVALTVLNKAFDQVKIRVVVDRDDGKNTTTPNQSSVEVIRLNRREFENYLFDKEVLSIYSQENDIIFNETEYNKIVNSIDDDDVKAKANSIFTECLSMTYNKKILLDISELFPETNVYQILKNEIFPHAIS